MSGVYTIAPEAAFVDALAAGILAETGDDKLRLLDYTILLPTRRACRALREAFLRATDGQATLLPAMRPLGDVEGDEFAFDDVSGAIEAPPVIPALRRRLLLTRLIMGWGRDRVSVDQAARLAMELERFLDQVQTERLSFEGLAGLAPERFAEHWQKVLDFLAIVTKAWPDVVREQGGIDPAAHRNLLLESLAARWAAAPPKGQVIAAGSTGSIPATADLLAVIAAMPNGRVVLPGLMRALDAESWRAIGADQTHPQHNLARLLERLELTPDGVRDWAPRDRPSARSALIAEVMRPAATTQAWRALDRLPAGALDGVQRIDCADAAQEAGVIALILRQALETLVSDTKGMVAQNSLLKNRLQVSTIEIKSLRTNMESLQKEVMTDALTGIANRKFFDILLRQAAEEAMENGGDLSLAFGDIDHFKKFNDNYGHQTGDQVLKLVGMILTQSTEGDPTAARYGGEEFAIILPGFGLDSAAEFADKVRITVASKRIRKKSTGEDFGTITMSIGVAQFRPGEPIGELVHRADQGLYHAKDNGRNCVMTERELENAARD